nr:hypothetical protein [Tanacetum cinerariifolium]
RCPGTAKWRRPGGRAARSVPCARPGFAGRTPSMTTPGPDPVRPRCSEAGRSRRGRRRRSRHRFGRRFGMPAALLGRNMSGAFASRTRFRPFSGNLQ